MIIPHPIAPYNCDVLIYDTLGSSWLHQCIPNTATWRLLDIRHQRPIFLKGRFFSQLKHAYSHYADLYQDRLYLAYITAVFEHIKPRVILTFADNNVVLGPYAEYSTSTLVVAIQNAIRGTVDSIPPKTRLPIYYSLGSAERKVFDEIGVTHQEYIPVGSVKLGLFLQQHYQNTRRWDLSFCSHYRPELVQKGASKLFRLIENAHKHLFRFTCQYAKDRNLSVAILSKTREPKLQEMEETYFRDLADGLPFSLVLADKSDKEYATYQGAFASDLIINLCSTLGYEAFGAGKKVLFGSGYRKDLLRSWGAVQYYEELPDFTCLQNDSFEDFSRQADVLISMTDQNYRQHTHRAARYYLAMPSNSYPHEIIRKRLTDYLNIS